VISFTPHPLYPQGKSPWRPLYRRLGGSQNRSGRGDEMYLSGYQIVDTDVALSSLRRIFRHAETKEIME
jgi:hypothetical protein